MSKKKKKKPPQQQPQQNSQTTTVRLSQVMIVKNEEKNIKTALSWAKDVAYEQIVVDTGSTDRTVELAEKMGAKVYHFKWVNDFSAAKNFAMDLAKGNWIAILDADEYMLKEDVKELMSLLKKIQSSPQLQSEYDSVKCSWVQLSDDGKAFAVLTQHRIFQNRPDLRYVGKIHEAVRTRNKTLDAQQLRIMHTGYSQTAFDEAGKRERNTKMLRDEHKKDPTDPHIMLYLADSIKSAGTEESREEAEKLYLTGLTGKRQAEPAIKRIAYDFLIPRYINDNNKTEEAKRLCSAAIKELPDHIDYYYYRAVLSIMDNKFREAMEDLQKCEHEIMTSTTIPETRVLMPSPILLFYQLSRAAKGLGNENSVLQYSTVVNAMLTEGKNQPEVLGPYMAALFQQGKTGIEVFEELAKYYNLNDAQDMRFIAHTAKNSGIVLFAEKIMEMLGEEI
jgi:glycosyltransferase involved in cell wall biosynthesis